MHLHEAISRPLTFVCVPEPGVLSMEYTKQEYPVYGTGTTGVLPLVFYRKMEAGL